MGFIKNMTSFINVIKYNGSPDVFAWKYPKTNFNTSSQLIVNESQEAILFKGGQALDVFGPGSHTLTTKNIPILAKLINLPFGGESPFSVEIWYVNKINNLNIKWGTPQSIPLFDPFLMVGVKVRSFGQFGISIENSKKFLTKLVGTLPAFTSKNITDYFKGEYLKEYSTLLSSYFTEKNIGVLQINAHLKEISEYIKSNTLSFMEDYGISLINFNINNISADENDESYQQVKQAMAGAAKTRWTETAKADTMAYEQQKLGYTYQQRRSYDVMESAASNEGGSQNEFMGMGMGLAMGGKMGAMVGNQMGNMVGVMDIGNESTNKCPKCGAVLNVNQRFCSQCGTDTNINDDCKCIKCGAIIAKDSKFCPECGSAQSKKCTNCNADISENVKFCPECGTKIE